jgi:alpha-beta hydrolase superfamily lysophospholipase
VASDTDLLGPPYQRHTMELGGDDEGPVVATLVHRRAPAPTRRAVLWVHGWSDYFFQAHVADFFIAQGFDFYALDLRKYGRSLLGHQTPNFCRSLTEYLPELDEAARIIRAGDGHDTLLVAAHSTGALIAALWAHRRRAARIVDAMFLNSPFFEFYLPAVLRAPAGATAARLARRQPYGVLRRPRYPVYGQSLHADHHGEWSYDLAWKPTGGFPIRYGWLAAIRAGQRRLHAGLSVDVPILVGYSARSYRTSRWHELARRTDTVLNVADMVRWAPQLGRHVTLVRINGGLHDLTLSAPPVRAVLFSELARWTSAYVAGAASGAPPTPEALGTPAATTSAAESAAARTTEGRTPPTVAAAAPADPG